MRPAAVRRAVASIDAHASLPITVGDVAVAAGTTSRALHAAFRRHQDTTVGGYLRRRRLDAARRDLLDANSADDAVVVAVAAPLGFAGPAQLCARAGIAVDLDGGPTGARDRPPEGWRAHEVISVVIKGKGMSRAGSRARSTPSARAPP